VPQDDGGFGNEGVYAMTTCNIHSGKQCSFVCRSGDNTQIVYLFFTVVHLSETDTTKALDTIFPSFPSCMQFLYKFQMQHNLTWPY
jgi:hypothetical protein